MIDEATLQDAISRVGRLVAETPGMWQLRSVHEQLQYVLDYVQGRNDGARMENVEFGLLTVREIEPRDLETADILYRMADDVARLRLQAKRSRRPS